MHPGETAVGKHRCEIEEAHLKFAWPSIQPVHAPLRHYYLLSQNSSTNIVAHFHWALSLLRSFCAPTCQPQLFMSPQGSGHLWLASPRWNILGVCSTKSNKTSTKHSEAPCISTSWMIWMPVHGHSKAQRLSFLPALRSSCHPIRQLFVSPLTPERAEVGESVHAGFPKHDEKH